MDGMELRHLRHFVSLAEERSFTAAASRELIVQSGLSSSVRALEKEMGALLFVRGTRPVRLTAEGEALLPAARHALDAAEAARQAVRDVHGVLTGTLRIGALQTSGHTLPFAAWLAQFSRAHPGVDISVRELPSVRMLNMVADGELDCALVSVVRRPQRRSGRRPPGVGAAGARVLARAPARGGRRGDAGRPGRRALRGDRSGVGRQAADRRGVPGGGTDPAGRLRGQ